MDSPTPQPSLEELQAGHALADLDAQEMLAWRKLAAEEGIAPDESLEWIAAQLEIEAALQSPETVPTALMATLLQQARDTAHPPQNIVPIAPTAPASARSHNPWWGWAAAAVLAILLVIQSLKPPTTTVTSVPLEVSQALFVRQTPDLVRLPFAGTTGDYAATAGEVLWSDQKQQGYLLLEHLPVNDPSKQQYQLWIVDPKRDEIPVDGGVFDIPSDQTAPVIIEIQAKLIIQNPQAFVITVEQPGGVVRSKQEKVAGIAKPQP